MYKDSTYIQGIKLTGGICDTCRYNIVAGKTNAANLSEAQVTFFNNVRQDSVLYLDLTYSIYDSIYINYGFTYSDSISGAQQMFLGKINKRYYIESNTINDYPIENNINIYPNPTTGKLTVKAEGIEKIEVYNITGKTVYTGKKNKIDLSLAPKGIYFIKVTTNKGVAVRKIIKN